MQKGYKSTRKVDLKKFRSSIALLKKQGLISGVDARSALPQTKIKGKSLLALARKYDDVVSGKVVSLKLDKKRIKEYRRAGYSTAGDRVLVPISVGEKVTKERSGKIVITSTNGIERVQIPVEYHNLEQYLRDIKRDTKKYEKMKRKGEQFAFRFHGANSISIYAHVDDIIEHLSKYEEVLGAGTAAQQRQVFQNLQIIRLTKKGINTFEKQNSNRKTLRTNESNRTSAKRYRRNLYQKSPEKIERYLSAERSKSRSYRQSLKGKKLAAYKKAAKARAKKSRELRRKKK